MDWQLHLLARRLRPDNEAAWEPGFAAAMINQHGWRQLPPSTGRIAANRDPLPWREQVTV